MSSLATGWQAVSYGHATFSIYNFVSAGAENPDGSTSVMEESMLEPASEAPSVTLSTLSEPLPAFS